MIKFRYKKFYFFFSFTRRKYELVDYGAGKLVSKGKRFRTPTVFNRSQKGVWRPVCPDRHFRSGVAYYFQSILLGYCWWGSMRGVDSVGSVAPPSGSRFETHTRPKLTSERGREEKRQWRVRCSRYMNKRWKRKRLLGETVSTEWDNTYIVNRRVDLTFEEKELVLQKKEYYRRQGVSPSSTPTPVFLRVIICHDLSYPFSLCHTLSVLDFLSEECSVFRICHSSESDLRSDD